MFGVDFSETRIYRMVAPGVFALVVTPATARMIIKGDGDPIPRGVPGQRYVADGCLTAVTSIAPIGHAYGLFPKTW